MDEHEPQFQTVGRGDQARRIAYLTQPGGSPGVIWMQGFKSEMTSLKATALADWACERGRNCTRFDYSGHGQSEGRFENGTLTRWREEAAAVFHSLTTGPQILVGSSMGGYIALLLLQEFSRTRSPEAQRIKGLVLIAPAWNMTEELMWSRFPEATRRIIETEGVWHRPSQYGDPYPITRQLIEDGRLNLLGVQPWNSGCPIHIIHGREDPDVPFSHSERLLTILTGAQLELTEIPDGEHRLSRPQDLAVLFKALGWHGGTKCLKSFRTAPYPRHDRTSSARMGLSAGSIRSAFKKVALRRTL